jgi:hypothetical protein
MIEKLKKIEREELEDLLENGVWNSLHIDYHPPRVERVWIQLGENRLSLHVMHPCEEGESLRHPHAWKTGFHILPIGNGKYEQEFSLAAVDSMISEKHLFMPLSKMIVSGEMYYEMTNKNCGHYVRPIDAPIYSIMLNGPVVWPENKLEPTHKLLPLQPERVIEIKNIFKEYFFGNS